MQFSSNKKINKIIKKIISAFIIAMISLSICFVFFQVEPINVPGKTLQNIVYDNFFRLINDISKQDKSKTDDVIIVAIDDASLKNGILTVYMHDEVPESQKPRQIAINASSKNGGKSQFLRD